MGRTFPPEQLIVDDREGRIVLVREVDEDLGRGCPIGDHFLDLVVLDPF